MLTFVFIFFIACNTCNAVEETVAVQFSEKIMNLSLELFYYTEKEHNCPLAMAPFTIWNLISVVAFRTGADTWKQLQAILGISKYNGRQFNSLFIFVNDLLVQQTPGRIFKSKHVIFYDSDIEKCISKFFPLHILNAGCDLMRLNFDDNVSAAKAANDYMKGTVFAKTDFEETSMIVSGKVKFSGAWTFPFDDSNTVLEDGYLGKGKVHIMHQWANLMYADIEQLGASVLELPYGEYQEYSMIVIRPQEGLNVTDVLNNFAKITFLEVMNQLYSEGLKEVEVRLPKFSLTSTLLLNGPLMSMGARDVFSWYRADFSGISSEDIYISALEQRVTVMVGDAGIVAEAHMPGNFADSAEESFYEKSQPFLYFIVHRQYMTIIFCGRYGE